MRRRGFLTLLSGAAAYAGAAKALDLETRRVGVLTGNVETDSAAQARVEAFRRGMADLGRVEGRNLRLEVRWPGPDVLRQQDHARELVALAPEVILATSTATTRALLAATRTIPIVFVGLSDPVATGVVTNLARPEANATGFMLYEHSLAGKWLTLLKDVVPAQFRDGASYVDRILRGARPAELPVQFATKFDLVINLKTADVLGLKIPRHLLVGAEVIR